MRIQIIVMGVCFWVLETAHFGWNLVPTSDAEIICDGITLLILAVGFVPITTNLSIDKLNNNIRISSDDLYEAMQRLNEEMKRK